MHTTLEAANLDGPSVEPSETPVTRSSATERDLVRRLQEGGEIAYREFVERYQFEVYRVAHGIIGDRKGTDELAQQIFVKLYFSVKSFDGRNSLYTWVYRIVVNECYEFRL